jgi:glycosyltransferase involved in cell wall biosynthesis
MILKITPVFNEASLLPFHLRYYDWVTTQIFFDFGSTDNSNDIIKKYAKQTKKDIRFIKCHTEEHREDLLMLIRNHYYKQFQEYNWIVIADVDEFVYAPNLTDTIKKSNADVFLCSGYNMFSENQMIDSDKCIVKQSKLGVQTDFHTKMSIFKPDVDIRYSWGCHEAYPEVKGRDIVINKKDFYLLHYRFFTLDIFRLSNKMKHRRNKIFSHTTKYGHHYDVEDHIIDQKYLKEQKDLKELKFL